MTSSTHRDTTEHHRKSPTHDEGNTRLKRRFQVTPLCCKQCSHNASDLLCGAFLMTKKIALFSLALHAPNEKGRPVLPCIARCISDNEEGCLLLHYVVPVEEAMQPLIWIVSAEDETTGNKNGITINNEKERLSGVEIKRMIEEAALFREEDEKFKKMVEVKNSLDEYIYSMEKAMKDFDVSSKVSPSEKQRIMVEVSRIVSLVVMVEERFLLHSSKFDRVCVEKRKKVDDAVNPDLLALQRA
ncbi:heat shock 70 kDa protein, mitochondrial-like [Arachis duranensis]|uniref:Heat shock 70 kDa protein, mitochondrial-like n=1 Tax=Arachis duranensis TaxID=130453 RepID=A0A6P5M8B0_ARADU|nr:heat shock 70 kDa protein, mitochondrial-like [Arachis duranensis]